jgi:hypothetical protein
MVMDDNNTLVFPGGGPDSMSVEQAAVFLRVDPVGLVAAAQAGQVPSRRRRGRVVFSRAQLLAAMTRPGPWR